MTFARKFINKVRYFIFKTVLNRKYRLIFLIPHNQDELFSKKLNVIRERLLFYGIDIEHVFQNRLNFIDLIDVNPIVRFDMHPLVSKKYFFKKLEIFNLDYDINYMDAWDYHRILTLLNFKLTREAEKRGHIILKQTKNLLRQYEKAYVFGTGPSLENIESRDWDDGIRIVSNTIVKDTDSWNFVKPHFIVAGDAIYHFGQGQFAKSFRRDLKVCLSNSKDTLFVFPSEYYVFCYTEFNEFKDRLVPVPQTEIKTVHHGLINKYELPETGNVLPLLLLPLASTFVKNIFLWAFDGRSPNDKNFWKNSDRHFYNDFVDELKELHPAFFNKLIPKNNPEAYVKSVHGDALENILQKAESDGFVFRMLHQSYTETLAKRYVL